MRRLEQRLIVFFVVSPFHLVGTATASSPHAAVGSSPTNTIPKKLVKSSNLKDQASCKGLDLDVTCTVDSTFSPIDGRQSCQEALDEFADDARHPSCPMALIDRMSFQFDAQAKCSDQESSFAIVSCQDLRPLEEEVGVYCFAGNNENAPTQIMTVLPTRVRHGEAFEMQNYKKTLPDRITCVLYGAASLPLQRIVLNTHAFHDIVAKPNQQETTAAPPVVKTVTRSNNPLMAMLVEKDSFIEDPQQRQQNEGATYVVGAADADTGFPSSGRSSRISTKPFQRGLQLGQMVGSLQVEACDYVTCKQSVTIKYRLRNKRAPKQKKNESKSVFEPYFFLTYFSKEDDATSSRFMTHLEPGGQPVLVSETRSLDICHGTIASPDRAVEIAGYWMEDETQDYGTVCRAQAMFHFAKNKGGDAGPTPSQIKRPRPRPRTRPRPVNRRYPTEPISVSPAAPSSRAPSYPDGRRPRISPVGSNAHVRARHRNRYFYYAEKKKKKGLGEYKRNNYYSLYYDRRQRLGGDAAASVSKRRWYRTPKGKIRRGFE